MTILRKDRFSILILIVSVLLVLSGCRRNKVHQFTGLAFGTYYAITYCGEENTILAQQVDSILNAFSAQFSVFDSTSVISRLNRGEDVALSPEFEYIIALSQRVSQLTNGAFDITVAPLVNLWGFGPEAKKEVTPTMLDSVKEFVGYQKISVENHHLVRKDNRIQLNLNAIAKGYAVDILCDWLQSLGYGHFLVDIGGEIRTVGSKCGENWKVGIQIPTDSKDGAIDADYTFEMANQAIATSGNYRNYYEQDGQRYAHIIDPISGYPKKSKLLSATVIAQNCAEADAFATAFMVLGSQKWEKGMGVEAYFISDENGNFKTEKTPRFP